MLSRWARHSGRPETPTGSDPRYPRHVHALKTRLAHQWAHLQASFWFVPGLMVLGSILLAGVALAVDAGLTDATLPG